MVGHLPLEQVIGVRIPGGQPNHTLTCFFSQVCIPAWEEKQRFLTIHQRRKYLSNVSPATIEWYEQSLRWLAAESPTDDQLKDFVMRMRAKELKATARNNRVRAVNVYLKSTGSALRVAKLKEPQYTFSSAQVTRLIESKPRGFYPRCLYLIVLMLLDTGRRISQALGVRVQDCDLDNLLLRVTGKGQESRKVPFSFELRKVLVRYAREFSEHPHMLLFGTRDGRKLARRVVLIDVNCLCSARLRCTRERPARISPLCATSHLRRGGSVFHLQKVLGHSSLEMTRRYTSLLTKDLQAVHEKLSLLSRWLSTLAQTMVFDPL
jgi:integrase/recombinase XerD